MNQLLRSKHAHSTPRQKKAGEAWIVSEQGQRRGRYILVPRRAVRSLTLKLVGEDDDKERQEYLA